MLVVRGELQVRGEIPGFHDLCINLCLDQTHWDQLFLSMWSIKLLALLGKVTYDGTNLFF